MATPFLGHPPLLDLGFVCTLPVLPPRLAHGVEGLVLNLGVDSFQSAGPIVPVALIVLDSMGMASVGISVGISVNISVGRFCVVAASLHITFAVVIYFLSTARPSSGGAACRHRLAVPVVGGTQQPAIFGPDSRYLPLADVIALFDERRYHVPLRQVLLPQFLDPRDKLLILVGGVQLVGESPTGEGSLKGASTVAGKPWSAVEPQIDGGGGVREGVLVPGVDLGCALRRTTG
jgi:hypothetical protein